jgi:hypothetical protein
VGCLAFPLADFVADVDENKRSALRSEPLCACSTNAFVAAPDDPRLKLIADHCRIIPPSIIRT